MAERGEEEGRKERYNVIRNDLEKIGEEKKAGEEQEGEEKEGRRGR